MKKRFFAVAALIALSVVCTAFAACTHDSEPLVLKESDTFIIIKAEGAGENDTLVDYMNKLKASGDLEFEMSGGMVTSVNGIANPPDYSSCWMLYTGDEQNANSAWGTVEYEEKLYGSATQGAETLKVKSGEIYIWVYQSF